MLKEGYKYKKVVLPSCLHMLVPQEIQNEKKSNS